VCLLNNPKANLKLARANRTNKSTTKYTGQGNVYHTNNNNNNNNDNGDDDDNTTTTKSIQLIQTSIRQTQGQQTNKQTNKQKLNR
jgi:hypothetical protein